MGKLRLTTLRRVVLLIFVALFAGIILRWISLERWHWEMTRGEETQGWLPMPAPSPKPTATRPPVITGKIDLPRLFNGVTIRSEVETAPGGAASEERVDPSSYLLDLKLNARVPTPNRSIEELSKVNADLGRLFPALRP